MIVVVEVLVEMIEMIIVVEVGTMIVVVVGVAVVLIMTIEMTVVIIEMIMYVVAIEMIVTNIVTVEVVTSEMVVTIKTLEWSEKEGGLVTGVLDTTDGKKMIGGRDGSFSLIEVRAVVGKLTKAKLAVLSELSLGRDGGAPGGPQGHDREALKN